jgi:phosphatidylinositol alpha 1,6-mannosyltransferase
MRVAIITESFAPDINGVANSVLRVAEHLVARGHKPLVIAPDPRRSVRRQVIDLPYPVVRVPSLPLPGYTNVRLALPSAAVRDALSRHRADVVHLASPFVLGAWGSSAAQELGLPIIAVYQTDVPGYTSSYGLGPTREAAWRWIARVHGRATLTLAPSTPTADQLRDHGVRDVLRWGRGVDSTLYHPRRRDEDLRRELLGDRELLVGYIGRLAHEKCVDLLSDVVKLPGVRVVVVGDGPARRRVARALPSAVFTGTRSGADLARHYASLDVFVHTGPLETFCQTIQEAQASGVPVVAPASGGPLDLVQPGLTGYLVRPGDPADFAAAVGALAADPESRRRFGATARSTVENRTWAAVVDELIGHYRTAIGAPDKALELAR